MRQTIKKICEDAENRFQPQLGEGRVYCNSALSLPQPRESTRVLSLLRLFGGGPLGEFFEPLQYFNLTLADLI
jgi:hypothetical protein